MLKWFLSLLSISWGDKLSEKPSSSTEFVAEVVLITEILPHGNADSLEVAKFELKDTGPSSYEVIIKKDSFRVGDLAAYFSVDCLLPLAHKDFEFLKRPDSTSTKTIHRLRAARLRGRFSQGLLVPSPRSKIFGTSVAEHFGVTYFAEDEPEVAQNAGAKKTKPQVFPVYGVNSLKKSPTTFAPREEVVITEKVHGSNMRFGWIRKRIFGIPVGWKFVVGSHRVIKGLDGSNHFYGEDVWLDAAERHRLAAKTKDYKGHIFYGELFGFTSTGKKIQDLTYGRKPENGPGLILFDVQRAGRWLDYDVFVKVCTDTELDRVPLLYRGPYDAELVLKLAEGKSTLSGAEKQIREGCVVAAPDGTRKSKFVGQGYLLRKDDK